ncbi:MAG: sulfotransferase [Anaerolineales bacterium]
MATPHLQRRAVRWVRWGMAGVALSRLIRPQRPSVLVLSFPRSGSSWVGETLGRASNALYLREPITQDELARGQPDALLPVDAAAPPPAFQAVARKAFSGLPDFPPHVVKLPQQWRLVKRRQRRLVIKEVMPFACGYLTRRFRPRVVFLVRHPAAVALSFCELGWWSAQETGWFELGARQSRLTRVVLDCLEQYPAKQMLSYEELCLEPARHFRELFAFAGLTWDEQIENHIAKSTSGGDRSQPYATDRLTQEMPRAWTRKMTPEALRELRAGYESCPVPWYTAPEEWTL